MERPVADHVVDAVARMSVPAVRAAFAAVRRASDEAPDDFWDLLLPGPGLTVGEFCLGYLLRTPGGRA